VEHAAPAARSLEPLAACADTEALTATVPPPKDPDVVAQVAAVREDLASGSTSCLLGRFAEALEIGERAAAAAHETKYLPLEAEAELLVGEQHMWLGDDAAARPRLVAAAAAAFAGRDPLVSARALSGLVLADAHLAHFDDAHAWADLADATATHADGYARGELADRLAQLLLIQHRLPEAHDAGRRAVTIWEASLGSSDMRLADPLTDLANVELAMGHYADARVHNERAITLVESAVGKNPLTASNVNNLGDVCLHAGDYACAVDAFTRANALYTEAYGESFFGSAVTLSNLAEALRLQGHADRALPLNEKALALMEAAPTGEGNLLVPVLESLGETYRVLHRYGEALATFARALSYGERTLGKDHPDLAATLTGIGETRLDQGKPGLARAPLERAMALRDASPGDPLDAGETRFALARATGRSDLARQARGELASAGPRGALRADEVDAWLRARGGSGASATR
jgi:tetratricopeptide (TPR) repeat protein